MLLRRQIYCSVRKVIVLRNTRFLSWQPQTQTLCCAASVHAEWGLTSSCWNKRRPWMVAFVSTDTASVVPPDTCSLQCYEQRWTSTPSKAGWSFVFGWKSSDHRLCDRRLSVHLRWVHVQRTQWTKVWDVAAVWPSVCVCFGTQELLVLSWDLIQNLLVLTRDLTCDLIQTLPVLTPDLIWNLLVLTRDLPRDLLVLTQDLTWELLMLTWVLFVLTRDLTQNFPVLTWDLTQNFLVLTWDLSWGLRTTTWDLVPALHVSSGVFQVLVFTSKGFGAETGWVHVLHPAFWLNLLISASARAVLLMFSVNSFLFFQNLLWVWLASYFWFDSNTAVLVHQDTRFDKPWN